MQAPTFEPKSKLNIHPASDGATKLYHNGILKDEAIKMLQKDYDVKEDWDTQLLLLAVNGMSDLSEIDGSFSCLWYNGAKLFLFRNEIAPMFIDNSNFDISSTSFANGSSLPPNTMYSFNLNKKTLFPVNHFRTKNNPYFFGD